MFHIGYAGGITENVKKTFDDMTATYGFTCDCWHFEFTHDGGSSLKQKASCTVHQDGKTLGHAEVVGSLEYDSHSDDEYTFDYTLGKWSSCNGDPYTTILMLSL